MTGLIIDIKKFAIHDGPGIRTTVFFKGCSLSCQWCHNPESRRNEIETICVKIRKGQSVKDQKEKKEIFGRRVTVEEIMDEISKDKIFYEQSGGGVTFSGGEPMMQVDFLCELLKTCKNEEYHTVVDTSGYAPTEDFDKVHTLTDLFLFDLKLIDEKEHKKYVGVSNKLILENITQLLKWGNIVVPRIPLIPDITDTETNLQNTADFLAELKTIQNVSLLPYNKLAEDKRQKFSMEQRLGKLDSQTKEELNQIAGIFERRGFQVSIGG
ncbi:MAG: glycyl-radical enzyme activating protein [candidate division Zixibacteria bacterium]